MNPLSPTDKANLNELSRLRRLPSDNDDAGHLAEIARKVHSLQQELKREKAPAHVTKAVQSELVDRAGRVMFERIWEIPRRLSEGPKVLNKKFALDAAWIPEAIGLVRRADGTLQDRDNWNGKLQLEHVVPAGVIYWLISECSKSPKMTDKKIADIAR